MPKHIENFAIRARLAWFVQRKRFASVAEVCRYFGISRKTYYKWERRLEETGGDERALADRRRTPKRSPRRTAAEVEARVIELRRKTGYGPYRIWYLLNMHQSRELSVYGVYRVLVRSGLHVPKKRRRHKPTRVYTQPAPGDKVQIDVLYGPKLNGVQVYQWTAIDVCTRVRLLWATDQFHSNAARAFLGQVIEAFPFPIRTVQTDNDSVFTLAACGDPKRTPGTLGRVGAFTDLAQQAGIKHKLIPPASPTYNGHVERSHRTDREEFYRRYRFTNLADLRSKLARYLRWYNNHRPHMGLNGLTPRDAFLKASLQDTVTHVS